MQNHCDLTKTEGFMNFQKKSYFLISTLLFVLCSLSYVNVKAQTCSYQAWQSCSPSPSCYTYQTGDIVSHSGSDWQLISTSNKYWEPGVYGWTLLNLVCLSNTVPIISATEVRGNYCTTSFSVGKITGSGGSSISERGFVFGTSSGPDLSNADVLIDAGTGVGDEFEGLMENLTPNTPYFVRTYATNSTGTEYGTEATFTTRATSDCVTDCNLACDITDPSLTDPSAAWWTGSIVIAPDDTVCITSNINISATVVLHGMLKICNSATITIGGSINVYTPLSNPTSKGQVVYEGCDEIFDGTGSYADATKDPLQMISYCATCDENDTSQFFSAGFGDPYQWVATCRPTSTLNPLPVELIHFATSKDEEGVLLEWTTAAEINNSHFEIEISYDGVSWTSIGIVQGSGNSATTINYSFVNNQEEVGVQYYRLKQVDFNGDYAFSNIRYFSPTEEDKPSSFIAFQNIENEIEVNAVFHGMGEAYLIDSRGKIVEMKSFISSNKSGVTFNFNASNLKEGIYFVQIKSGNALLGAKVQVIQK